jgi:hypothetical protein
MNGPIVAAGRPTDRGVHFRIDVLWDDFRCFDPSGGYK